MMFGGLSTMLAFTFYGLNYVPYDSLGSKCFYGTWICALYILFPGCYATFAPATKDIFGPDYFAANYGLVFSQNVSLIGTR